MGQLHEVNLPGSPLMEAKTVPSRISQGKESRKLSQPAVWIAAGIVAAVCIGFAYADGLTYLVEQWLIDDNYSHGFFIPLIVCWLIWLKRERMAAAGLTPSWWGAAVLVMALGLFVAGELATLMVLIHLSFWLVIVGLFLAAAGPRATWEIAFPLGYLLTMFPLPQMLQQNLSSSLQLLSSTFGVGCLQLIGVTAFREGNVIDLGPIQLQVVEACSGLRYLFPLVSLALLCGYLFQDRLWKRVVLVGSAIPLAILLNGVRIGVIGVLVEWYGQGAAEGFMHFFEGWIVFVVSLAILLGEMKLLSWVGPRRKDEASPPAPASPVSGSARWAGMPSWSAPAAGSLVLLAVIAALSFPLEGREDIAPVREQFLDFPMEIAGWRGNPLVMEKVYVDALRFDDYLLADYQTPTSGPVNFYVAYYRSQRKGQAAHSPKTCMPGGGWEMTSLEQVPLPGMGTAFYANRAVIQKGDARQVVLYWFKQRERIVTNEYLVKAWLFWDSITRHRSDGALVRLVTPVRPGEDDQAADRRLQQFAAAVQPTMMAYVPD